MNGPGPRNSPPEPQASHSKIDSNDARPSAVVALGASAGGLRALQDFFHAIPVDTGLAFVVVQHLSPDFKSLMAELLARHTALAIHRVEDGMILEPNSVYLIPPKSEMTISGWTLHLKAPSSDRELDLPIDVFFESMAQAHGRRCAAVVLSGTGSDGSRGVPAVHRNGGLVIVQNLESAEFDGMPNATLATQMADAVLTPAEIAPALVRWIANNDQSKTVIDPIHELLDRLRTASGIDFNGYKQTTVRRRVDRRMNFRMVTDISDYLAILSGDEDEIQALLHDLLIGVTGFFRDSAAFKALEKEFVENLIPGKTGSEELRIWVTGCATGEEAYSVAILAHRSAMRLGFRGRIRVFATDVHRDALEIASAGIYQPKSIEDVPEDLRTEYFSETNDHKVKIAQVIRDSIVFAPHNLLVDPPFTNLDLVTCRNLMIYLEPRLQDYVLSFFQYALRMSGTLFLGASEGTGRFQDDYHTIDSKWKIYRKTRNRPLPVRITDVTRPTSPLVRVPPAQPQFRTGRLDERRLLDDYNHVLRHSGLTAILIDEFRKPMHVFGNGGNFLAVRDGRFDDDFLKLLDDNLRLAVSTALQKTARTRLPTVSRGIRTIRDDEEILVDLQVTITGDGKQPDHFLIVFQDERPAPAPLDDEQEEDSNVFAATDQYRQRIRDLEQELQTTRESLQATVEELQTTNEELQSTNEELQAANEEMQSANEELHSVNEELYTVNAEYESKNDELAAINQEHVHLLNSLDVGTIFLDRDLRIRKYNPAICRFFNLLPQDIGRPLSHIAYHLEEQGELEASVLRVIETNNIEEAELQTRDGECFLKRALPFRREDGTVDGAILTLTDVSALRGAQNEIERARLRYDSVINNSLDGVLLIAREESGSYHISHANAAAQAMLGMQSDLTGAMLDHALQLNQSGQLSSDDLERAFTLGERKETFYHAGQGDSAARYEVHLVPAGDTVALTLRDRSIAMAEQERLTEAHDQAQSLSEAKSRFLAMMSHELRTPLNGVIGAAEIMAGTQPTPDQRDLLETINISANHLLGIIDDMLDLARIERGELKLNEEMFEFSPACEAAASLVAGRAFMEGLEFGLEIDPTTPHQIKGDRTRLIQVLVNLMGNAVKYTDSGQVQAKVSPSADGTMTFTITDTGIGIPEDQLDRIFEPFTQIDSNLNRRSDGAGLGLAICLQIIDAMQGTIAVESKIGQGTTVTLTIPIQEADKPWAPPAMQSVTVGLVADGLLFDEIRAQITTFNFKLTRFESIDSIDSKGIDILLIDGDQIDHLATQPIPVIALARGIDLRKYRDVTPWALSRPIHRAQLFRTILSALGLADNHQSSTFPESSPSINRARILVAEDNVVNQLVIQRLLEALGHEVILANNGVEAVELAQQSPFDLAILDLLMPQSDGFECARKLRTLSEEWTDIPILALTASDIATSHQQCIDAGFDAVLSKPITATALKKALHQYVKETIS